MKQPLDHLRSKKKPVRKAVWIAGDSELAEELSELEASLTRAKASSEAMREDNPRREAALQMTIDLEAEVAAKREEVRGTAIKFVLQGMGSKEFDAMAAEYPPTDAQLQAAKDTGEDKPPFDTDTYPIALIVASTVEPEMEPAELHEWLSDPTWNSFELLSLFMAANEVNNSRKILNLGKG